MKRELSVLKKEEDWDKDLPQVSLFRVLALNAKEWWIIILGALGAFMNGSIFPLFAIIFGEIVRAFSLRGDMIISAVGMWAGIFLVLGTMSGVGVFLKVN